MLYPRAVELCKSLILKLIEVLGIDEKNILIGGPHITSMPNAFLSTFPRIKAIAGFGEEPVYNIVTNNHDNNVITNTILSDDIMKLSLERRFFMNNVVEVDGYRECRALISSRGCPYSCKYCLSANSHQELIPIDLLISDISCYRNDYNSNMIHFLDDVAFDTNARLRLFI